MTTAPLLTAGLVRAYMESINPVGADPITDNDLCWFNCLYNAVLDSDMSTTTVASMYKTGIESMYSVDSLQATLDRQFGALDGNVVDIAITDCLLRMEIAHMLNRKVYKELEVRLNQLRNGEVV